MKIFQETPLYANKEMLILISATSTCDAGDIFTTIADMKNQKISCSVIGISGRNYIFKVIIFTIIYKGQNRCFAKRLKENMMSH